MPAKVIWHKVRLDAVDGEVSDLATRLVLEIPIPVYPPGQGSRAMSEDDIIAIAENYLELRGIRPRFGAKLTYLGNASIL